MPLSAEDVPTVKLCRAEAVRCAESGPLSELQAYLVPGPDGTLGRLGRYDVVQILGQGGFGIVVKAFDASLQRFVAIKILSPRFAFTSPPRKYFLREARSAAKVNHEHVVQIHCVEDEPLPYLVMEHVEGETLQQRLDRSGPLEPEEAVRIGRQIALGLAAAHATGVVHRDIKPANILLEKGDPPLVKISDFGIARTADDASLTEHGYIVGTPQYMSPEQATGAEVDQRSDLFSLGSVLYTMVVGRTPFRASKPLTVLKRIVEDSPRSPRQVNPAVGKGLSAVIARLHAKSPADRYASALEVAQALDECLTEKPASFFKIVRKILWGSGAAATLLIAVAIGRRTGGGAGAPSAAPTSIVNTPLFVADAKASVSGTPCPEPAPKVSWEDAVAALPAKEQLAAVNARLQTLNPKYDGAGFTYTIQNGGVEGLVLNSAQLTNITPIHIFKDLRELTVVAPYGQSGQPRGGVSDLGPLRGMTKLDRLYMDNISVTDLAPMAKLPITSLTIWGFAGRDLAPLQGMKLKYLNCGLSKVEDLTPLRGMPLEYLCLNISDVSDLTPLKGMKLKALLVEHTKVRDLGPAWDMPLESLAVAGAVPITDLRRIRQLPLKHIWLDYNPAKHLELLRSIKTLEYINYRPAAEVLATAHK